LDEDRDSEPDVEIHIEDLKIACEFINGLRNASLDNEDLPEDVLTRLRHPLEQPLDIDDPDIRLSIDLFLSISNASQDTYTSVRAAILRRHPDNLILSFDQVKRKVAELSGVASIIHHMCPNSCVAYTGPYANLENCPKCGESRFDPVKLAASGGKKKAPRQEFHTIPLGPQLQALWRSPESANAMKYRHRQTEAILQQLIANNGVIPIYEDFYHGQDYINAVTRGDISAFDTVIVLSIDGAQLYSDKASDCWMFIWTIFNLGPDLRYKKKAVLPGGFIPGPNKPKNVDSYIYPSLHHLSALQHEGLPIWDAQRDCVFIDHPFFALGTADGPGMTYLNGLVGHHGAYGCRLYCTTKGRHKPGGGHYFAAHSKPSLYPVPGCDHDDIDIQNIPHVSSIEYKENLAYLLGATNETNFKERRKETGITKPSIFSGLPPKRMLDIPGCFPADLMHLISLNLTDLLIKLWRGTMDCETSDDRATWDWAVLKGNTWKNHGKTVADATPYLPGSFDRPPRNPAEKISSGYKAWEYLVYIFVLGPALLHGILPDKYWRNYCKLVKAIRLIHQCRITREQLREAHKLFIQFVEEYEQLYYQRRGDRIHFCRQSLHALLHIVPEIVRVGPGVYYTQWTMERTIGNLGEEIKQPSKPYANLSQRGVRRSQVNTLKAMIPDLEQDTNTLPRGAVDLGNSYVLLRARDKTAQQLSEDEEAAVRTYFQNIVGDLEIESIDTHPRVTRWSRLRLPNGQVARSAWKECLKTITQVRIARQVKVCCYSPFIPCTTDSLAVTCSSPLMAEMKLQKSSSIFVPGSQARTMHWHWFQYSPSQRAHFFTVH
jgi:hypothetical protein